LTLPYGAEGGGKGSSSLAIEERGEIGDEHEEEEEDESFLPSLKGASSKISALIEENHFLRKQLALLKGAQRATTFGLMCVRGISTTHTFFFIKECIERTMIDRDQWWPGDEIRSRSI